MSKAEAPHEPMAPAASRRPVMRLLEQLGRTATPRIMWELRDGMPQSFRAGRVRTGVIAPPVLNGRRQGRRAVGLGALADADYVLPDSGRQLVKRLQPLNQCADRLFEAPEQGYHRVLPFARALLHVRHLSP